MKLKITSLVVVCLLITLKITAQTIWTGSTITFNKPDGADWNLEQNQDRITDNVWLTRQNNNQIFNIAQESSAFANCSFSPADTEWAVGTTNDIGSLTFDDFTSIGNCALGNSVSGIVAQGDLVLHLISEDIYIDIKFTYWGSGGVGGFTYERSTDQTLSTDNFDIEDKVEIFPNPVANTINFKDKQNIGKQVVAYDMFGREVFNTIIPDIGFVDISHLKSGTYILNIDNNKMAQFIKL